MSGVSMSGWRSCSSWRVQLLAGLLALCLVGGAGAAAPTSLADETGAIAGKVTEAASPHAPIAGINVCAYLSGGEGPGAEEEPVCAITGAGGEYTISNLSSGQYTVEFSVVVSSGLNYVTQYYDNKQVEAADLVTVNAPAARTGIDAQLAVGGEISGSVSDAESGSALQGTLVCAASSGADEGGGCAISDEHGAYTVRGLAGGSYSIFFFHPNYQVQYYDGKASPAEAALVNVVPEVITAGIDAALRPGASTVLPPLSSSGKGGAPGLGGAPVAIKQPFARIRSRTLMVKGHSVYVKVGCEHARCVGRIDLVRAVPQHKLKHKHILLKLLALGSFSIAPGHERVVALHLLSSKVPHRFADARSHPLSLRIRLSVRAGNSVQEGVRVS